MRRPTNVKGASQSPARMIFTLVVVGMLLFTALPARAFSQAFFPTQSRGNRGVDVQAMQLLLRQHGSTISADGVFGPATYSAVTNFQARNGLDNDGVVGPLTWGKLIRTVRQGSRGEAVKAVQTLLNAKRRLNLAVDGVFGPATSSAVRTFQAHAGISQDAVVGPTTWRNLLWHYDYPNFALSGLCDYGSTSANWGTGTTVGQLESAAIAFGATGNGPVAVGDISLEHGGDIAGHASHEVGLDIDVRPIRTDNRQCASGCQWNWSCYDRTATRLFVQTIRSRAPGHVRYIFFNDPVLIREGLTTYESGHDNHLHIRYCEKVHPNSRYDC